MVGLAVWIALVFKYNWKTSAELDLRNKQAVLDFYNQEQPEVVIDAAVKVGSILANDILTLPSRIQYSNYTGY